MASLERGLLLKPYGEWDGISREYEIETNSNYLKCADTRRSVIGCVVYLNGAPVSFRSSTPKNYELIHNGSQAKCCSDGHAECTICLEYFKINWFESEINCAGQHS